MDEDDFDGELVANGSSAFYVQSWESPQHSRIKSFFPWYDPEEVPFRIAICGAHGTGKKSLATALATRLKIDPILGVGRTVGSLGLRLNKSASDLTQVLAWLGHLWENLEYDEFVSAGSLIDSLAYLHYLVDKSSDKNEYLLRALSNVTNNLTRNEYTVYFYLPIQSKPKPDGVRSIDSKYQKDIDRLVLYYLNAFDLDYFPLPGTPKQQLDSALSYLNDFGLRVD